MWNYADLYSDKLNYCLKLRILSFSYWHLPSQPTFQYSRQQHDILSILYEKLIERDSIHCPLLLSSRQQRRHSKYLNSIHCNKNMTEKAKLKVAGKHSESSLWSQNWNLCRWAEVMADFFFFNFYRLVNRLILFVFVFILHFTGKQASHQF